MTDLPTSMQAAVYDGPGALAVRDLPVPRPGAEEVLVRVERCGVCGSDLHLVLEGWGKPGTVGGHEWSGRVAAVGSEVTGWQVGDVVVGGPTVCGTCRWCRAGRPALCVEDPLRTGRDGHGGAFAEYVVTAAAALRRVPAGLDARTAALAEPLAVALHAVTQSGLTRQTAPRTRVLVTGAGPIGLLLVSALADLGVRDLVVSEPAPVRRQQAVAVGATSAVAVEDLPEPPALPTRTHPDGFDVAFDCSGRARAMGAALGLLVPAGRLVLVGTGSPTLRLDTVRVLFNELVVTGAYCYDATGIDDALALLASGRLTVEALAGVEDVPLDGLLAAMKRLAAGDLATKVLVRP